MTAPKLTFVVSLATWYRGSQNAELLTSDGDRCCLGFVATQLGVPDEELLGRDTPSSIGFAHQAKVQGVLTQSCDPGIDSSFAYAAMCINDDRDTSDEYKMRELSALAARHGFAMVFVP